MSPQLAECIAALPEGHWKPDMPEIDAIREWAEVNYLPSDGIWKKEIKEKEILVSYSQVVHTEKIAELGRFVGGIPALHNAVEARGQFVLATAFEPFGLD